jgi:hypothetical protein
LHKSYDFKTDVVIRRCLAGRASSGPLLASIFDEIDRKFLPKTLLRRSNMKNNNLIRILVAAALLIVAVPVIASAQVYNPYDPADRYDRSTRVDVRDAIARLDNAGARLQSDLNAGSERRVLGGLLSFRTVDNDAVAEVRDFRRAVRDLRASARGGYALERSVDEARVVLDRGVQLDRYLRLRTGRTSVDSDLAEIRSDLHVIADAYGLSVPY